MSSKHPILPWSKIIAVYVPILVFLVLFMPQKGHEYDTFCWTEWSKFSFQNGLTNIYKSWTDYLPLYHYVLFAFGKVQGSVEEIAANIYKLKAVTLLFELGSTLLLFKLLHDQYQDVYKSIVFSLFYFLNFAVLYNSLLWGQVDGILAFFLFASFVAAYYEKPLVALLFFVLALNIKLQAMVYLPLLGAVVFPLLLQVPLKRFLLYLLVLVLAQVLLLLPFMIGGDLKQVWNVAVGSVDKYPVVSMNAFNLWFMLLDGNLVEMKDSIEFWGISYKRWGLLMFMASSFFALLFLVKPYLQFIFQEKALEIIPFRSVLIAAALIPLLFFFFNTQMHERYTHPTLIFLAAYALLYKRPVLLLIGSLAYFLNMEDVFRYLQADNYDALVYTPWFVASLYLLTILLLFFDLYNVRLSSGKKLQESSPVVSVPL